MSVLSTLRSFFDLSQYNFHLLHAQDQRPKQPAAFRFLDLSAELRNTIYYLALVSDTRLFIPSACKHDDEPSAAQPALTRVNRQIRAECLQLFYAENKFYTHIHRCDFGYFFEYMEVIGEKNRGYIRDVCMHLKDRLNCGGGFIDLLRWCTTTEGIKKLELTSDVSGWNMAHKKFMKRSDRKKMLEDPAKFDKFTEKQTKMFRATVSLAREFVIDGLVNGLTVFTTQETLLADFEFDCLDTPRGCLFDRNRQHRDGSYCFEGICSRDDGYIDERRGLAAGCTSRSQNKAKREMFWRDLNLWDMHVWLESMRDEHPGRWERPLSE